MTSQSLTLTKIPHLNILVVKQRGIHYFLAAPDSFLIDKTGFINLIRGAMTIDFISDEDLSQLIAEKGTEI